MAPGTGEVEIRRLLPDGVFGDDIAAGSDLTVEGGTTLRIRDRGASLANQSWYQVVNAGSWEGVCPFEVSLSVLIGDVIGLGVTVRHVNQLIVNTQIPCLSNCGEQLRADVDGDGRILSSDVIAIAPYLNLHPGPVPTGHCVRAALLSSIPAYTAPGGARPSSATMWRTAHQVLRFTFAAPLDAAPLAGQLQIRELLPEGAFGEDLSPAFDFSIEKGHVLRVEDRGATFHHRRWYAFMNHGGWIGACPFEAQFLLQVGDVDGNGVTVHGDAMFVLGHIPCVRDCGDQSRQDVDGDGRILSSDALIIGTVDPSLGVAKPSGH